MRGDKEIIAIRAKHKKPPFVFVNDYPCKTDWFEHDDHATVCTHGDPLSSMDFRFLVDLNVSISATSEQRAKAIFEKVKDAGAKSVAACHIQSGVHPTDQSGWVEVWHKEVEYA